ncbi:MAG: cobalamin-dependent protein, partial [Fusobacteriaceae bacterium]
MKKYLLVALNSQYIHTNLAVRYIKKYVEEHNDDPQKTVEVYESNINNQLINIVRDIYEKSPDVVIFSTYIWNREYVFKIIGEMKKIVPGCKIGLGG